MRDSLGNVYALALVFAFIIVISGFLAFSVNYNKAFKMKNRIITILEKYNNNVSSSNAQAEIKKYASEIGYGASQIFTNSCPSAGYTIDGNNTGYCYHVRKQEVKYTPGKNVNITEYSTSYVDIRTFVSIDIPILNHFFPHIKYFHVDGSTKQITTLK